MGIVLMIGLAIAAGLLIFYAIKMTIIWLKSKIRELMAKKNVKKVLAADLEEMVRTCSNKVKIDDFLNEGYTDVIAAVNDEGKLEGEVELVKNTDENHEIDGQYRGKGMVLYEN